MWSSFSCKCCLRFKHRVLLMKCNPPTLHLPPTPISSFPKKYVGNYSFMLTQTSGELCIHVMQHSRIVSYSVACDILWWSSVRICWYLINHKCLNFSINDIDVTIWNICKHNCYNITWKYCEKNEKCRRESLLKWFSLMPYVLS